MAEARDGVTAHALEAQSAAVGQAHLAHQRTRHHGPLAALVGHARRARHGFVVPYVALSVWLIVATAIAVSIVIIQASGRQVEREVDRRLIDGAALFQATLNEEADDLTAVGTLLQRDPNFIAAAEDGRRAELRERLALALQLHTADELSVADQRGEVIGWLGTDRVLQQGQSMTEQVGFQAAVTGRPTAGIAYYGEDFLRQELYVPIRPLTDQTVIGVLCLSAFLDQEDLDRFRRRTGLDASLFSAETRVVSTLPAASGLPGTQVVSAPDIFGAVVAGGQEISAWRDLPTGRARAHFLPLNGPNGAPIGMFSTSLPAEAISGSLGEVLLPSLPLVMAIVVAGAALAYALARRVQRPVLTLAHAAARIRDGDLLTPVPDIHEPTFAPLAEELERARSNVHARLRTIADAERRQRALFAALQEPVFTTSADGRITGFNAAASDLFGGPVHLYGQLVDAVLPFVDTSADTSAEAGGEVSWQGRIEAAHGATMEVEVSRKRVAGTELPPMDIFLVRDVTRYAELGRMREQLLYSVAHEVRGPLTVLDNVLDILANGHEELTPSELSRLARSARSTAARLHNIVEALLSAGSIQSGRFDVHPTSNWLSSILDDAVEVVEPVTEARGQRVERTLPSEDLQVLSDRRYVRQVLWNLLSNASKYSPEDELIRVQAETAGDQVRVTVEDRGPGIPLEQQTELFERFYRARSSRHAQGIGLGLAIARAIVEAHGGTIGVDSAPGAGTRVWFTLRLANPATG